MSLRLTWTMGIRFNALLVLLQIIHKFSDGLLCESHLISLELSEPILGDAGIGRRDCWRTAVAGRSASQPPVARPVSRCRGAQLRGPSSRPPLQPPGVRPETPPVPTFPGGLAAKLRKCSSSISGTISSSRASRGSGNESRFRSCSPGRDLPISDSICFATSPAPFADR